MKIPRYYQEDAIQSLFTYFEQETGNPLVALPTGTGKSLVIAEFIRRACAMFPHTRILKLTHDKKLVRQNFNTLLEQWPTVPGGVCSAGLKKKQIRQITFGTVGTVIGRVEFLGHIDLVIIDEAHRISPKEKTTYRKLISKLQKRNPFLKVIGLTATPYRQGQGMLTEGEDALFTHICCDWTTTERINQLIDDGFLCMLRPRRTVKELDLTTVRTQGGEYVLQDLQKVVDREEVTFEALKEALELAHDRHHWLVFCCGVEHVDHVTGMLNQLGVPAVGSHSKMSDDDQNAAETLFVTGQVRALVNNDQYTTGFDYPDVDCIIILRPTKSTALWVQMLGRGTRPVWPARDGSNWHLWPQCYPDRFNLDLREDRLGCIEYGPKRECLVLDFAANTKRLGPFNRPVLPKQKGKGTGEAPSRICEACDCYNHASARVCVFCGHEFPRHVKFGAIAAGDDLIVTEAPQVEIFPVLFVSYKKHTPKDSRPPSMCATYTSGLRSFSEWVCLEHDGFAGKRARDWWRDRDTMLDHYGEPPHKIDDALSRCNDLLAPTHLRVWVNKKHPEIMAQDFTGTAFGTQPPQPAQAGPRAGRENVPADLLDDEDIPF